MTRRDLARLAAALVLLTLAGYLLGILVTRPFEGFFLDTVDRPAIEWLARHRTSFLDSFMRGATGLGAGSVVTGLTVGAALLAHRLTSDVRWSGFLLFAGIGGVWLDKILKPLVDRQRPDLARLVDIGGNSFPSGHATAITGLWLALALFARARWGRRAVWVWAPATAVIFVVALSRPYLGVHYPTDVVAGTALSSVWVVLCLRLTRAGGGSGGE